MKSRFIDMRSSDDDSPIRGEKEKGSLNVKRKKQTRSSESESEKGSVKVRRKKESSCSESEPKTESDCEQEASESDSDSEFPCTYLTVNYNKIASHHHDTRLRCFLATVVPCYTCPRRQPRQCSDEPEMESKVLMWESNRLLRNMLHELENEYSEEDKCICTREGMQEIQEGALQQMAQDVRDACWNLTSPLLAKADMDVNEQEKLDEIGLDNWEEVEENREKICTDLCPNIFA